MFDIKTKAELITKLPIHIADRVGLILLLFGFRKMSPVSFNHATGPVEDFVNFLRGLGFLVELISRTGEQAKVTYRLEVSQQRIWLNMFLNGHANLGYLYGYPKTASDAFTKEGKRQEAGDTKSVSPLLPARTMSSMLRVRNLPLFFHPDHFGFRLSREHAKNEIIVIERWSRSIARYAPALIDEFHSKADAQRMKRHLSKDVE